MRLGLRLVFCLLMSGALGYPGHAAEVSWRTTVGFGGVAKEGAWTPVFVDISNEGDSQAGQVTIPIKLPGRYERVVNYAVEVDLPRHSRKRYTIYLPSVSFDRVLLDLSRRRERLEPPTMQVAGPEDLLVVVIGSDPGSLSFLNGKKGFGIALPEVDPSRPWQRTGVGEVSALVGHLTWSELPESWIGWEGVDAVVVGDAAFSGASRAALAGLRQWVQIGGTLIVPGGAQSAAMASGPVADLLPGEISGTSTRAGLGELGEWCELPIDPQPVLAARLSVRPEAKVLCGTAGDPLIAMRKVGSGRVIFTTFDFTASPVKYWEGQNALWPRLLANRSDRTLLAKESEGPYDYWGGPNTGLVQVASTMPEAELPSLWLIVGFLVAYIVVLVPVNYSFLHRIDRRELAWVTTPAIVLVFTLGAYAIGYGMRGGTIVLNRVGIIEADAGARAAHGMGYLGIFSPARTSYEIALQGTAAGARDLARYDQHVRGRATVYATPKPRVAEVVMNMWTTRPFGVEFLTDLGEGITGYLEYDGANFVGRVRNGSTLTLKDCRIVRAQGRGKGQEVKPGEEVEVAFIPSQTTPIRLQPQYGGSRTTQKLDEAALSALFNSQQQGPPPLSGGPLLVATTKDATVPAALSGRRPSVEEATLVVVHLPIRLARHQLIQVPTVLVESRVLSTTGFVASASDPYSGGDPGMLQIEQGSIVTEFAVPTEGGRMRAQGLELVTSSGAGIDPAAQVEAYDFARRRWEMVRARTFVPPASSSATGGWRMRRGGSASSGPAAVGGAGGGQGPNTVALPHPWDFMSPDGRVQVKVAVPSGSATVSTLQLNATVKTE